jgi:hypothetical protein
VSKGVKLVHAMGVQSKILSAEEKILNTSLERKSRDENKNKLHNSKQEMAVAENA